MELPVIVTDVQQGFVGARMAPGEKLFWMASPPGRCGSSRTLCTRKSESAKVN